MLSSQASSPAAGSRASWSARCERLGSSDGFALITAIIVLLVVGVLAGAAISVSSQTSVSTTRDTQRKAALEAAEAGLQVATYRLSELKPGEAQCINGNALETPSGSYCAPSSSESLGNNASFRYWTSLPLGSSSKCAGRSVELKSGFTPRCITAEGTDGNLSQRLAVRVEAKAGEALFNVAGVLGLSEVKVSGSVNVPGLVATNEKIIGEGSAAFAGGYELCPPKGSFTPAAGSARNSSGVTVGGVGGSLSNPPYEKTRSLALCPFKAAVTTSHATAASNEDSRIGTSDKLEGTTTWNASTHELSLASNGKLTLSGSKYYLCSFTATRNSTLVIAAGAKVEIFVDSPEDAGSSCKSGTGQFEVGGAFVMKNEAKSPSALLIQMYGKGPFEEGNGGTFEADIYAPAGEVNINGGTTFRGGIVGNKIHLENGAGIFEWTESSAIGGGVAGSYARYAWEQCAAGSGAVEGC